MLNIIITLNVSFAVCIPILFILVPLTMLGSRSRNCGYCPCSLLLYGCYVRPSGFCAIDLLISVDAYVDNVNPNLLTNVDIYSWFT